MAVALLLAPAALGDTVPIFTPDGPISMPSVGLGTAFGWDAAARNQTADAVASWLKGGGRAIHTAWMYCNQRSVAEGLKRAAVPRGKVFLISMMPQWHMGYQQAKAAVTASLAQLGTTQLDLFLVHWPGVFASQVPMYPPGDARCGGAGQPRCHVELCDGGAVTEEPECKRGGGGSWKRCRLETWRALCELQAAGILRAVGTSNWETWHIRELLDAGLPPPAVNQVPFHVGFHDDLLLRWSAQHNITTQAYSPLGGGGSELVAPVVNGSQTARVMAQLSADKNRTAAQVALKFVVASGAALVTKVSDPNYMAEDRDLWGWELSNAEVKELSSLSTPGGEGDRAGNDPASMMCVDREGGSMARCIYRDVPALVAP